MRNYKPRKVFVLYGGVYKELTYEEFEKCKENDCSVADKLFIPVQGCLVETDRRHYNAFYRDKERQKYLQLPDKLRKAVDALPEDEKTLIVRHFYDGIPQTELAEIYGMSQQAISKKLSKIRAKLKKLLEI